jgi:hypothetical protein
MSAWTNSAQWRPPQFGIFYPTEYVPFLAWLAPAAVGVLLVAVDKAVTDAIPAWPQSLDQLGLFGGYIAATLLFSPLWGFPAIVAIFLLRLLMLYGGLFGWASALIAGAIAGVAVPVVFGQNFWLIGPLYGAVTLWMQHAIYRAQYPSTFDA